MVIYATLVLSLAFGLAVVIESYRVIREAAFLSRLEPAKPTGSSPGLGTLLATSPSSASEPGAGIPAGGEQAASKTAPPSVPALSTAPAPTPAATGGSASPRDSSTPTGTPTGAPGDSSVPSKALDTLDDLGWPVTGRITVAYGWQASNTHSDWRMHTGVDLKAAQDSPVRAAAAGRVVSVERDLDWDVTVTLAHAGQATTVYANLSGALVKAGDVVARGQTIGRVGTGGAQEVADGAHLHFEVRTDGEHTDPKAYLK